MWFLSVKINWKTQDQIVKYNKVLKTTVSDEISWEETVIQLNECEKGRVDATTFEPKDTVKSLICLRKRETKHLLR